MSGYDKVAHSYDSVNGADYEALIRFTYGKLKENGLKRGDLVLDLGCGTGILTKALYDEGYDMIGVDGSEGMLSEAREREPGILWLQQDIREFELYGTVKAIVCTFDVLNHIPPADIAPVFDLCSNYLDDNGLLLFDLCTEERFLSLSGGCTVTEGEEDLCIIRLEYDEKEKIAEHTLTVFYREGEGYLREDTTVTEYCYGEDEIEKMLSGAGFYNIEATGSFSPSEDKEHRTCISCRRKKRG